MLNSKNFVSLEGNLVADPEQPNDNIMTFRMAVDNGGYENNSLEAGFFTVKVFYNGMIPSHAEFVKRQVSSGNFAKGTRVTVLGQLRQERWTSSDDGKRDKIILVAHSIEYASGGRSEKSSSEGSNSEPQVEVELPDAF